MGEQLGEGFILIRPDMSKFRAELEAQLVAATRNLTIPVGITAAGATGGITGQLKQTENSIRSVTKAQQEGAKAARAAGEAEGLHALHMERLRRGAAATALALFGVRGATLAASGAFLAGAAAVAVFAKSLGSAVAFDRQLNVFKATAQATATQMEAVGAAAKQLGADVTLPGVSATDAAEAMTELAKAGLSVQDSIDGARGVLQLATAAAISNADAVTLAASALNAFGLAGADATHVADVLTNAANAAQGSISDMGLALQQAAAVGHQVGLTFEDTTGFLTTLARAGLRSSDAGTSLRVAIIRLIKPTKDVAAEFKKLGISVRDAQGNLRPDFFVNLGAALADMSKKQRDATLALIGGQDAVRALSILTRQTIGDLLAQRDALERQGSASDQARARTQGLAGAGAALANQLETISIGLGERVTPALTSFVQALTSAVGATASLVGRVSGVFHSIGVGVPEIAAAAAAFLVFRKALVATEVGTVALAPALATAGVGIRTMAAETFAALSSFTLLRVRLSEIGTSLLAFASSTTGVLLALTALTAGIVFLATREGTLEKANRKLADSTDAVAASLGRLQDAQENQLSTQERINLEQQIVEQDKANVATARAALESSKAAEGSFARTQLENNLATTIQTLELAEARLAITRKAGVDASEQERQAAINLANDRKAEAQALEDLIRAQRTANFQAAIQSGQAAFLHETSQEIIDDIQKRIDALREENTASSRSTARRLEDLLKIEKATGALEDHPHVIELLLETPDIVVGLRKVEEEFRSSGNTSAANFVESLITGLTVVPATMDDALTNLEDNVRGRMGSVGATAAQAFVSGFTFTLKQLQGQIAGAARAVLEAQVFGTEGGEIAGLTRQRDIARRAARRARAAGNFDAEEKFLQEAKQAQDQLDSIRNQQLQDAKSAAADRKRAAQDAQRKLDDADQAFLAGIGLKEDRLQNRLLIAEASAGLRDDIAANTALRNFLRRSIAEARHTIHDALLRARTILSLTRELIGINKELKDLRKRQAEELAQERKDARDRRRESLQLDIQLAQARGDTRAEIRAREAYIRFLQRLTHLVRRNSNAHKQLLIEIQNERNAIKDLKKETKKRNDDLKSLEFEFLQAQQGFAATLLSNILPFGAIGGTVGGRGARSTGGGVSTPTLPGGVFGEEPARLGRRLQGATAEAFAAGGPRPASQGQMATLIHLNRLLLAVLKHIDQGSHHPEADHQRKVQSAVMAHL